MRKGKKAKQGEEGAQDKPQPERKKNWKEYTATVEDIQNFISCIQRFFLLSLPPKLKTKAT